MCYNEKLWLAFSYSAYKFTVPSFIANIILGVYEPEKNAKSSISVTSDFLRECYVSFHDEMFKMHFPVIKTKLLFNVNVQVKGILCSKNLSSILLFLLSITIANFIEFPMCKHYDKYFIWIISSLDPLNNLMR